MTGTGPRPPPDWSEAQPRHILAAYGYQRPDVLFLSAPCQGFSGCLDPALVGTPRYEALNGLTLRGMELVLRAYEDDDRGPVPVIIFENVPGIARRGLYLLREIIALLKRYGYLVSVTPTSGWRDGGDDLSGVDWGRAIHDCGEIGGLGQTRRRFLMVARHPEQLGAFIYEPPRVGLRTIRDVIGNMPRPNDPAAGPMHALPTVRMRTYLRLALIQPGRDWRHLQTYDTEGGLVRDRVLCPREGPQARPVEDVSVHGWGDYSAYGVVPMDRHLGCLKAKSSAGTGAYSIADDVVGVGKTGKRFNNVYRVVSPSEACTALTGSGAGAPSAGAATWADPKTSQPWRSPPESSWSLDWRPKSGEAPVIVSEWGHWHRPLTPLECAGLQGWPVEELYASPMPGRSTFWRKVIGNAVPVLYAKTVMEEFMTSFLLHQLGESEQLRFGDVWVAPDTDPVAHLRLSLRTSLSTDVGVSA